MENIITICLVLIILIAIYLLIKFNKRFRSQVYSMFLFAEHNVIKGKKMDYVVNQIYELLPVIFQIIPKSAYKKIIQNMFDEIKDLLDDGKVNKSSKRGKEK